MCGIAGNIIHARQALACCLFTSLAPLVNLCLMRMPPAVQPMYCAVLFNAPSRLRASSLGVGVNIPVGDDAIYFGSLEEALKCLFVDHGEW